MGKCLLLVSLFLLSPLALAQPRTFIVPLDLHGGLILLKGEVNGKPATLLLDTGANNSIVDTRSAGFANLKLDTLRSTDKAGAEGACAVKEVRLTLEHRDWLNRRVCVMDLLFAFPHPYPFPGRVTETKRLIWFAILTCCAVVV